jgi:UDP-3-O-[3-hydroxymyristoyl] N-acetylglucosamine deacetylase
MHRQRTLNRTVACKGLGLHTGRVIHMKIHPTPEDQGIVFLRTDVKPRVPIPARLDSVVDTTLATTLGRDGVVVSTVEHLLSACLGMGVDNALVELDGPEVPVMDGSAAPFVYLLRSVGTRRQARSKKFLVIQRPFHLAEGDKRVSFYPASELKVSFAIRFKHPLIRDQFFRFSFSDCSYDREICKARTFGFLRDVEGMKSHGYALGGSLDNAVVLDDFRVLNEGGLRYPDEFVRHKILDSLGDLSLLGMPLIGHFVANKAGHTLNHRLMNQVMGQQNGWKVIQFPSTEEAMKAPYRLPSVGLLDVLPASA